MVGCAIDAVGICRDAAIGRIGLEGSGTSNGSRVAERADRGCDAHVYHFWSHAAAGDARSIRSLDRIRSSFHLLNPDRRVQIIIVAWLFGSFVEGASGFGTPAAVCVPLLVGLRFPGIAAAVAGMLIQSTPVSFGAAGTPILLGVRTGLGNDATVRQFMDANHIEQISDLLHAIGFKVACLHAVVGRWFP